jgi:ubiquinone/menaquinone biosynthesis C-methylase UbiE
VPGEPGPPPGHIAEFVRSLGEVDDALDLGCGDGRLTDRLSARSITGADTSLVALERAQRRVREGRFVRVRPDEPLPFDDGSFDLVLCAETIEHVRDVQLLLSEARRVLRPGGELALTTPSYSRLTALRLFLRGWERGFDPLSPHLRFFSRRSLARVLDELGFDVVSLRRRAGTLLARARR